VETRPGGWGAKERQWLTISRLSAALLLTALAVTSGSAFEAPRLLLAGAAGAVLVAALGFVNRWGRSVIALLFLADLAWITVAVRAASRAEAGLGLLFAFVAFAAGLCLGSRLAITVSLAAGLSLVATAQSLPDLGLGSGWVLVQGGLVLVLGIASDRTRAHLSARERALRAAARELERMRLDTDTIVQNLGSGVLSVDRKGFVVHCNRVAESTLGLAAEAIRGRRLESVLPAGMEELIAILRAGLVAGTAVPRSTIDIRVGEGSIPLGVSTTVLRGPDEEATGVVALFQDLTEVRRQEALFRRRDRLAAVGELAAGVAHEIRNSLLPISGSVQLLAQEMKPQPEQAKLFEMVERETESIERFVSGLLRYSRGQDLQMARVDLRSLVEETADEVRLSAGGDLALLVEADPVWAWGDGEQLRQALRNLVRNAVDAVEGRGTIVLRAGRDPEDGPWIEVEDSGPGIPEGARARIMEPFYTSKPGGTGLGLALAGRIAEDHEGRLQLLEGRGSGARFRITLRQPEEKPGATSRAA
jgi:PAS domain S-box-containing protein